MCITIAGIKYYTNFTSVINNEKYRIMKRVTLNGTENTTYNKYAYIQRESEKFYFVSIQDKETLERHTRAFSKKTLKCVSNTSNFTKNCSIERFI